MNSKMVRVHIDKKAFFRVGFPWSNNFGLKYKNLDHGLSGRWFSFEKIVQMKSGQNHQPISNQITDGPSSYRPKLLLHENQFEIDAFFSIWTRTIFEFIYVIIFWPVYTSTIINSTTASSENSCYHVISPSDWSSSWRVFVPQIARPLRVYTSCKCLNFAYVWFLL